MQCCDDSFSTLLELLFVILRKSTDLRRKKLPHRLCLICSFSETKSGNDLSVEMASVKREGMWKSVLTTLRTRHVCESPNCIIQSS